MEAWLAWTHHACGRKDRYDKSKARLEAANAEDAALFFLYALEGDRDSMIQLLQKIIEMKSPLTLFVQALLLDYMGWPITDSLSSDPNYLELLRDLEFPPSQWSVD